MGPSGDVYKEYNGPRKSKMQCEVPAWVLADGTTREKETADIETRQLSASSKPGKIDDATKSALLSELHEGFHKGETPTEATSEGMVAPLRIGAASAEGDLNDAYRKRFFIAKTWTSTHPTSL